MQEWWLTTAHKRRTLIASESQQGVISSITPANSQQERRTSQQQNYIGIACSAHPMPSSCALTSIFLLFCPPPQVKIHADCICTFPSLDHRPIQLHQQGPQWTHLCQNVLCHVETAPGRHPSQQALEEMSCPTRVFRMHSHARPVGTCHPSHLIYSCGGQLWIIIHASGRHRTPDQMHQRKVQAHHGLGR
jgi:hypothetical protein